MRDFNFFTGTSNGSETFCTVFLYKFFIFPNFGRIFWSTIGMVNVQIITDCSVLDRFCFLMHSLLVLMKLSIYISGLSHGKVILQ